MATETVTTSTAQADTKAAGAAAQTQTVSTSATAVDPKADTKVVTPAPAKERISLASETKTDDTKKADEKSGDVKVLEGQEIVYDLKLPQDSAFGEEYKESVIAFAKEHKLPAEVAQKVADRDHAMRADFLKSHSPGGSEWTKRADLYEKESLEDPEIGGSPEKLKASAELGRRVLDKYFPPEVKKFLIESGLGSNKYVIKGFAKLAKAHKEDSLVIPGAQGAPVAQPGDLTSMYS